VPQKVLELELAARLVTALPVKEKNVNAIVIAYTSVGGNTEGWRATSSMT